MDTVFDRKLLPFDGSLPKTGIYISHFLIQMLIGLQLWHQEPQKSQLVNGYGLNSASLIAHSTAFAIGSSAVAKGISSC